MFGNEAIVPRPICRMSGKMKRCLNPALFLIAACYVGLGSMTTTVGIYGEEPWGGGGPRKIKSLGIHTKNCQQTPTMSYSTSFYRHSGRNRSKYNSGPYYSDKTNCIGNFELQVRGPDGIDWLGRSLVRSGGSQSTIPGVN